MYVINQQGRYLLNLWQQLSGRNKGTLNDFKELITGKGKKLQLSEDHLSNWLLLEYKINEEIKNRSTDEIDGTTVKEVRDYKVGGNELLHNLHIKMKNM